MLGEIEKKIAKILKHRFFETL